MDWLGLAAFFSLLALVPGMALAIFWPALMLAVAGFWPLPAIHYTNTRISQPELKGHQEPNAQAWIVVRYSNIPVWPWLWCPWWPWWPVPVPTEQGQNCLCQISSLPYSTSCITTENAAF